MTMRTLALLLLVPALAHAQSEKRPWGPEQATGAPNTAVAGDHETAWASATPDGQDEWLLLDYGDPVKQVNAVLVHETYNPGAVNRITAVDDGGRETELWKGVDPTSRFSEKGVSEIRFARNVPAIRKLKLY